MHLFPILSQQFVVKDPKHWATLLYIGCGCYLCRGGIAFHKQAAWTLGHTSMTEALCLMRWAYDICSSTVAAMAYLGKGSKAVWQGKPEQLVAPVICDQPFCEIEAPAHIHWFELRVLGQCNVGVLWDTSWEEPPGRQCLRCTSSSGSAYCFMSVNT